MKDKTSNKKLKSLIIVLICAVLFVVIITIIHFRNTPKVNIYDKYDEKLSFVAQQMIDKDYKEGASPGEATCVSKK